MQKSIVAELRVAGQGLTPALAKIAQYVRSHPDRVLSQTVTELAESSGSSEASVIRFCRDQGFASYQDLKLALATELAVTPASGREARERDAVGDLVAAVVSAVRETEELLDRNALLAAAKRLSRAGRVVLFGAGASAVTARYAHYKFTRLGLIVSLTEEAHFAAMTSASLGPRDVVLAVSSSGETIDTVRFAELAKDRGAYIIAITNSSKSRLTSMADAPFVVSWPETLATGGALPSKVSQFLFIDALITTILNSEPKFEAVINRTAESVSDRRF
jgi:RpiR family carbohydrate utilization transcriptional regulator